MKSLYKGMILTVVLNVLILAIGLMNLSGFPSSTGFSVILAMFIGISQLIHVIPVCLIAWLRYRDKSFVQGVLIIAGVTFLLNSICFGGVMLSL